MRWMTYVSVLWLATAATAATIYVPADFSTIQAAVNAASTGDEIVVAPGTYTSTGAQVVDMLGKAITLRASGSAEATILSGGQSRLVIRCDSGEPASTVIQGFRITGGLADNGGGVYCHHSSPTILDCLITNNEADYSGGGIACISNSNPIIVDCTISNNSGWDFGGGLYCDQSNPLISGCTISYNDGDDGGGIYCDNSNPAITNCTITNNTAAWNGGGGILCYNYSSPAITGCTISQNTADDENGGGLLCLSNSIPKLTDTDVCGNSPDQIFGTWTDGSGTCVTASCADCEQPVVINVPGDYSTIQAAVDAATSGDEIVVAPGTYFGQGSEVVSLMSKAITLRSSGGPDLTILDGEGVRRILHAFSNEPEDTVVEGFTMTGGVTNSGGAAMLLWGNSLVFTNCIITGNSTPFSGGAALLFESNATFNGCTFVDNAAGGGGGAFYCTKSFPIINGCTITHNATVVGGGIVSSDGMPTLSSTVVCSNTPSQIYGGWTDGGGNAISEYCCPDLDDNGYVQIYELLEVLQAWGTDDTLTDIDLDGIVGLGDLTVVIDEWGSCSL